MFLMRLMYITSTKSKNEIFKNHDESSSIEKEDIITDLKKDTIDQIKNITQEKKIKPELQTEIKVEGRISINSFDDLLKTCNQNKEIKLKYELEKNVNLVSFEKNRIEISFNNNLDKNFVKDISLKLFEWTGQRWIITLSKTKGEKSIKEKEDNKKIEIIKRAKDSELYKNVCRIFPDANLFEVSTKKKSEE